MRAIGAVAFSLLVAAYSSAYQPADPTLKITSPARGTIASSGPVTVTGTVTNANRVFVNGAQVTVAADGTFTTSVTTTPGIDIIETHAINGAVDIKDVRAV